MEEDRRVMYTVKHPIRLAIVLVVSVGVILLALAWALFLSKLNRRTADLSAYTTLTRSGETVTAVLDVDSLLLDLDLPDPKTEAGALRNGAVKALLGMELSLAFTEEPNVISITADVSEGPLRRRGIVVKEKSWTMTAKVLPRTTVEAEPPVEPEPVEHPKTVQTEGYLSSLLDEEGKGLNLRKVLERVRFERDRLTKEIFGSNGKTQKAGQWFMVYPAGSEHKNCYRAAFTLTETGIQEGRSIGSCAFAVEVYDLAYRSGTGVEFGRSEAAMYDTLAEAMDLSSDFAGCDMYELTGGSVLSVGRPSFDYNGFVRFVGLPMSHPLPDGSLWSPSADPLEEDDLWRLVGNGEYTMLELLSFVRMEILARHGYTFPEPDQGMFRDHFATCSWYRPTEDAPERYLDQTERRNVELLRELEALLES